MNNNIKKTFVSKILLVVVLLLSIAYICSQLYRGEMGEHLFMSSAVFTGFFAGLFCLTVKRNIKKFVYLGLFAVLILAMTVCYIKGFNISDDNVGMFFLILTLLNALCLYVPFLLTRLVDRINIRQIYKNAAYASMFVIVIMTIVGVFGRDYNDTITIIVGCIAFLIITRDSTKKEKWVVFAIMSCIGIVMSAIFGTPRLYLFHIISYTLSLLVICCISLVINAKRTKMICGAVISVIFATAAFCTYDTTDRLVEILFDHPFDKPYKYDCQFVNTDNDTISLQSFEGKDVVVMFWSAWCGACKEEFPYFSDLANEYAGDTTKVFISAFLPHRDNDIETYYKFAEKEYGFQWMHTVNNYESISRELDLNYVPYCIIVDKEGFVVYSGATNFRPEITILNARSFLQKE